MTPLRIKQLVAIATLLSSASLHSESAASPESAANFKKEKTPPGPPVELRLAQGQVESELKAAGFTIVSADRDTLPSQYFFKAQ